MTEILENNEKAYLKKYGVSLKDEWEILPDKQRRYGIFCVISFENNMSIHDLGFEQEDILRIVIGCRNKRYMEQAVINALPSARVVFWEPEDVAFYAFCTLEDISDIISDARVSIVFGMDRTPSLEDALSENIGEFNVNHRKIIGFGKYLENDNSEMVFFSKVFNKATREAGISEFTRNTCKQKPYENLLYALSVLSDNSTVGQLFERITTRNIPVIIVAAGPSLNLNCKELANAKGKSLIIAVTHAMKTMDENHITPDIIAATDSFLDSHVSYEEHCGRPLLCSAFTARECQEYFEGNIIFHSFGLFEGLEFVERINADKEFVVDTGSVAPDVFTLFLNAGFKTFILVGQDLAYDNEGYSHTGNEIEGGSVVAENTQSVEGINGGTVFTRPDWVRFREWYEKCIKEHDDIRVIDATEGGALIRGSETMPLKDAISSICIKEYQVDEWLRNIDKGDENESEAIKTWFEQMVFDCSQTEKCIDEAIELNQVIVGKWNDPDAWDEGFNASCRRYDMLYNMILNGTRSVLLNSFSQYEIQQYISNALTLEGDENIVKRMVLEQDLMVSMKKRSKELIEYLNSCLKKIENQSITLV